MRPQPLVLKALPVILICLLTALALSAARVSTADAHHKCWHQSTCKSADTTPPADTTTDASADTTPSSPATNLSATVGDGQVTLNWTPSSSTDAKTQQPYKDGVYQTSLGTSTTTWTTTGLTNGVQYAFRIVTLDNAENWSNSTTVYATPQADTTTDAEPSGVDPSGEPAPKGDLPGWRQMFVEDFATDVPLGDFPGTTYGAKWNGYPNTYWDTSKQGNYDMARTISVQGGVMDMWMHSGERADGSFGPLVAAPYPRSSPDAPYFAQLYGRYAVRFRADQVAGYKTAWLLWPTSENWPGDGEIDFPEGDLDGHICAFMHRQDGTSGGDQDGVCTTETYSPWHTAVIEWGPDRTAFILDGVEIMVSTERIPNTVMRWVLQTETSLSATTDLSAGGHVQVDWAAIYEPV